MPKLLFIMVALLASLAVACSDDGDDDMNPGAVASPGQSASEACEEREALIQSLQDLVTLDVTASGTDGITDALDDARADAEDLGDAISDDAQPELDALEEALADAREILANLDTDAGLNAVIDDMQEALSGIANASADLAQAVLADCP